jgi:fluoride exporter
MNWLLVFLGGGLGAVMRYGTTALTGKFWQHAFPLATLLSNVIACAILGIAVALLRDRIQATEAWYAFIVIGICGGYSTFSSFAKENIDLFEKGNYWIGAANIVLSVGLCLAAVWLGKKA